MNALRRKNMSVHGNRAFSRAILLSLFCLFTLGFSATARDDWQIVGLKLGVEPAIVTAVRGVPFKVAYDLAPAVNGNTLPEIPDDWILSVNYNAPDGNTQRYTTPLNWQGTLSVQPGQIEGAGSLTGWRIENAGGETVRLFDTVVAVTVLGDILVPQVEIKRLSYAEMRELGIILGEDNYVAVQVSMQLEIQESGEFLDASITLIKDENTGRYTPVKTGGARLAFAPVSFGFRGEGRGGGGILSTNEIGPSPKQSGRPRRTPPKIDAALIWPANIGFLNSFFKPTLIVLNVAPEESGYTIDNLRAHLDFPQGPLVLADLESGPQKQDAYILGVGDDGIFGTNDDTNAVPPQTKGQATWVLEGKKPGEHRLDFDIQGTIIGEDGLSYPIRGEAHGFIYVRAPQMNLHFDAPSTVREFDQFVVEAVFTNISDVPVNDLRFEFDEGAISGATVDGITPFVNGEPVTGPVILENKGDVANFNIHMTSLSTGRVIIHNVSGGEELGGSISYSVNVAVGEHGLPVSAVALMMPKALKDELLSVGYDIEVYKLIKVVAGRALSLTNIPPGRRENGFGHVDDTAIRDWIQDLTFSLMKPRSGTLSDQRRNIAREFYFASMAQPRNLVDFFSQDSKFEEMMDLLLVDGGDLSNLFDESVLVGRGAFLIENQALDADIPSLLYENQSTGNFWDGYQFDRDFDVMVANGTFSQLSGYFFNGYQWQRWEVDGLAPGEFSVIWNGNNLQMLNNDARVTPVWTYGPEQTPALVAARQMGYETVAKKQIDIFGRQVLLYFSEPVDIDDEFVKNFSIENNFVTRAERVRDQIVQVWMRNPIGLVERDIAALPGIRTERGVSVEPISVPIHMSDLWDAVTVEGQVYGPNGHVLPGVEVGLLYATRRHNNQRQFNFTGEDELTSLGHGEFAREVSNIIENYAYEFERNQEDTITYPFDFQSITDLDGYYLMEMWPLYRSHSRNELDLCPDNSKGGPWCVDFRPDMLWTVAWGDRRTDRRIFGHYAGQQIIRDFIFPPMGKFFVHVPPLPDGQEPGPLDVIQIQGVDQDEFVFDRVMLPGETIEIDGFRYGPVSFLAKAIGGFDAKSVNLNVDSDGDTIILNPSTRPAIVTGSVRELTKNGLEVPATQGFVLAYHTGSRFGGSVTQPTLLAAWNLADEETGEFRLELPEGNANIVYARSKDAFLPWTNVTLIAGEEQSIGTFLYREPERGEVTVTVLDTDGSPKVDYPVQIQDSIGKFIQRTDENGVTTFQNVATGKGRVTIPISATEKESKEYTLSFPDQLSTTVDFRLEPPYTLNVEVLDVDGSPVDRAWVSVVPMDLYPDGNQSGLTGNNGIIDFTWGRPPPGMESLFKLEVQHPTNYRIMKQNFIRGLDVFSETVTVQYLPTGTVDLTVIGSDTLEKLENVWVEITDASGNTFANVTNADGFVQFAGLSPGSAEVTMLPAIEQNDIYLETERRLNIPANGEAFARTLSLDVIQPTIPDRTVNILGTVFDAFQNPMVDDPVKFRLFLRYVPPGEEVPVVVQIGDDNFSNGNGGIELVNVKLPGFLDSYEFLWKAYHLDTGNYSTGSVVWDRRTPEPYIPIQMNSSVMTRVRVWDEFGNRMRIGSIKVTQHRIISEEFDEDNTDTVFTLSEDDFTPEFTVKSGSMVSFKYQSPVHPDGVTENTVIYPYEDGIPIDIVVQPLGSLRVTVNGPDGQPRPGGVFLQIFKSGRLWTERVLSPDDGQDYMTLNELPYGSWSILAYEIATGYTDVWQGSVFDLDETATLNLLTGKALHGRVLNTDNTPINKAHLILTRSAGTLAFSNTNISGVSDQELLGTTDENGYFTFPPLNRGEYNLRVFDPFTNRSKNIRFSIPETLDTQLFVNDDGTEEEVHFIETKLRPVGRVRLLAKLENGDLAAGATVTVFRNGGVVARGKIDGVTGLWTTPWMAPGAVTFMVDSLDRTEKVLVNAEILNNQIVDEVAHLSIIPYSPAVGFQWLEDGEFINERITVQWKWTAPGGVASLTGTRIYPSGEPIRFRFLEGRLNLSARFPETQDHRSFSEQFSINIDHSDDVIFKVQRPRTLIVTTVDRFGTPLPGVKLEGSGTGSYTNNNAELRVKNVTIGGRYEFVATSQDGLLRGAGSVIITDDLETTLTIGLFDRHGDIRFEVTQLGETYSKGLVTVTGNGVTYSQLLDGTNILNFRFLVEGWYRWIYSDPVRGVRKDAWIFVESGRESYQLIEVPGGGPLEFRGEYAGGIALEEGMVFYLHTQVKTFSAEIRDGGGGDLRARFDALPEGDWRLSTPTIPRSQWNPRVRINHGVVNRFDAVGANALPFWVRGIVTFQDKEGFNVGDFKLERIRVSDNRVVERRNYTNGLAVVSMPFGNWKFRAQPGNSPLSVTSDMIVVDELGIEHNVDLQLAQDTSIFRFPLLDPDIGFVSAWVEGYYADSGTYIGREYANPFMNWDYLPANVPLRFRIRKGSATVQFTQTLVPGFQELDQVEISTVPPQATLNVEWRPDGMPTLVVTTNKETNRVLMNSKDMTFDDATGTWRFDVTAFASPWRFGNNNVTIRPYGVHGANSNQKRTFEWPSAAPVTLTSTQSITELPVSVHVLVEDGSFEIDQDRLSHTKNNPPQSAIKVNGHRVPISMLPDGLNGIGYDSPLLVWPWRQGNNAVEVVIYDINGIAAGMNTNINVSLPNTAAVRFTHLEVEGNSMIEIIGHGPNGEVVEWESESGSFFDVSGLAFGNWQFQLYNDNNGNPKTYGVTSNLQSVVAPSIRTWWRTSRTVTVHVEAEDGSPMEGVPVRFRQDQHTYGNWQDRVWEYGSPLTDADGNVSVDRVQDRNMWVTADFGDYKITEFLGSNPPANVTIVDTGAGDILVTVINTTDGNVPVEGLDVFIDGNLVGQTDSAGTFRSQIYNAGRTFNLIVDGSTADNGRIFEQQNVTTIRGTVPVDLNVAPFFEGFVNVTLDESFDGLEGTIELDNQVFRYPLTQPIELKLREGDHPIRVLSRFGSEWFTETFNIVRNETTMVTLIAPPAGQIARALVNVTDSDGRALRDAVVAAEGLELGRTDTEGFLEVPMFPGTYQFIASHEAGVGSIETTITAGTAELVLIEAAGFSPLSIAGNILWLHDDPASKRTEDGDMLSTWVDLSGSGHHAAQGVADARPSASITPDGRQAVRFDGSNDFFNLEDGFLEFPLGFTAFAVVLPESNTWGGGLLDVGNGRNNDNIYMARNGRSDQLVFGVRNAWRDSRTTGRHTLRPYEYGVVSTWQVGDDGWTFRDGLETGTGGLYVATKVQRRQNLLGKTHERNVSPFHGQMVEFIAFNRALNPGELEQVGIYLADKYGLYHPQANWIGNYAADVREEIHNSKLSRDLADSYAAFLDTAAPVPSEGLTLWLKPDAGITEANGVISEWADQSPHLNDGLTTTDSEGLPIGPVLTSGELNGLPVARFNGDGAVKIDSLAPDYNENTTTFVLFKPRVSSRTLFSTTGTTRGLLSNYVTSNTLRMRETVAATDITDQEVWRTWTLMTIANDDNRRFQTRMHGRPAVDRNITLNRGEHARFELGRRYQSSNDRSLYDGDVAEVLVYNRLLTDLEIQQVENYLAEKYALLMNTPEPLFSPAGGVYSQATDVTMTTGVEGGTIYFTLDGSEPSITSASVQSGGVVRITSDTILKARVYPVAGAPSDVKLAEYVINPAVSTVVIDRTKTIWTVGTTEQDYEGKHLIITGAEVTLVGDHTFRSLRLINGAVLKHRSLEQPAIDLEILEDLYIDENSKIDVTGLGHPQEKGTGKGISGYTQGSGAGYGDRGGKGQTYRSVETLGGSSYGDEDPAIPTQFGSGGGRQWQFNLNGGKGGGIVKLDIGGNLYLDGQILAGGTQGGSSGSSRAGGGSGGSILITTNQIHGTGQMEADGATGYRSPILLTDRGFAGAAGGRISVNYDELNSTFPQTHLHTRNGLGGGAASGTVYVNGSPITQSAKLLVRAMDLNNVPMSGLDIRLNHPDGREIFATTNQFGYIEIDNLVIGETWSVFTNADGSEWRQNTPVFLADALHFHVMRVFDTAVALVSLTDPFFADKRLDWSINGEVSALNTEPAFDGEKYTYQFPVRADEDNRIVARLAGFQGSPVVDFTTFLDSSINGELFELSPNFLWRPVTPSPRAIDGLNLASDINLGAAYAYVDGPTGETFPLWEGTRVQQGTWSPENVYLPNDTSVGLAYAFEQDGVEVADGELLNKTGVTAINLPYAVVTGAVRFANGNLAAAETGALVLSDTGEISGPEPGTGTYRIVQRTPEDLVFDLKLGVTHGFLREQETGYTASTLQSTYDPRFEPHGFLFLPAIENGANQVVYVHYTENIGNYLLPFSSGYQASNWPAETGLQQQQTDLAEERTFYMPFGYWSVGGPEVSSFSGQFTSYAEGREITWLEGTAPLAMQDFTVTAATPVSQELVDANGYRLFAVSEHNPTYFHQIDQPSLGDIMRLPADGTLWFVLTYDQGSLASKVNKNGDGTIATSWMTAYTVTEADRANGSIVLDFSGESVFPLNFDDDHRLDIMPGLIRSGFGTGSDNDLSNVMAWSSRYDLPGHFLFNPIGWFSQVDAHVGPAQGEIVWRHKFQDFSRQLPGARIEVPLTYWPGDTPPSASVANKAVENLGMETVDSASRFMFGMLTGHNKAWLQPTIAGPVDITDPEQGDTYRRMAITMQLPSLFAREWSLVFPMLIEPFNEGDDTTSFAQRYQDWKTSFNTNDNALWLSLPEDWKTDAVNWNALPNGITGSAELPGVAMDVSAANDLVAVAHGIGGVTVFHIPDRSDPVPLINYDTLGTARAVAVSSNDIVAVADGQSGVLLLDMTDPQTSTIKAELALPGFAQAIAAEGNMAVAGLREGSLWSINLDAGLVLNQIELDEEIWDVALRNGLAYALTPSKLYVLEVDSNFTELGSVAFSGINIDNVRGRLFLDQDVALATVGEGYQVFNIADEASPQVLHTETIASEVWRQWVRDENGIGLAIRGTAEVPEQPTVYDLDNVGVTPPLLDAYESPGQANAVTIYNGLAYLADGDAGLQILNYGDADLLDNAPVINLFTQPAHASNSVNVPEGQSIFVTVQTSDDVQVGVVEFYLDDTLVAVDGNYPFEFITTAPRFATTPTLTLKARAIDVGGNATWSTDLVITVEQAALEITGVTPPDGAIFLQADDIGVFFNKPVNINSIDATSFTLVEAGTDGLFDTADDETLTGFTAVDKPELPAVFFSNGNTLPGGLYRAELSGSITDLDGNALGANYAWSFTIEGMLAHFTFDDHILDSSGNGNHADWPGGSPVPDRNGIPNQAYSFDPASVDTVFTRIASNQRNDGSGVTYAAWVYPTDGGDWRYVIYGDNGGWDWTLFQFEGKWAAFTGEYRRTSTHTVDLNVWQHVAAVFNPATSNITIYKNGVPSVISHISYDGGSRNLEVGRNFKGRLDEVRVFNQALTAEQIQTLYTMQDGDVALTEGFDDKMLFYYPFRDGKPFDWENGPLWDYGPRQFDAFFTRPVFTEDMHGNPRSALRFLDNNRLDLPFKIDQTETSKGFTASVWVYPLVNGDFRDYLVNTNNGGTDWALVIDDNHFAVLTGTNVITTELPVDYKQWQHVVVVFDPATGIRVYKNLERKDIPEITFDTSTGNVWLGARNDGEEAFNGRMDDVRLYDRVLTDAQIQRLYVSQNPIEDNGLLGRYSFNGTLDDSGPGQHHLKSHVPMLAEDRDGNPDSALYFKETGDIVYSRRNINQRSDGPGATFSAWIKPTTLTQTNYFYTDNGGWDWSLYTRGDHWAIFSGNGFYDSSHTVRLNVWQHIVVVFHPNSGVTVYKDGIPWRLNTIGHDGGTGTFRVAGRNSWMDDVRLYRKQLSAEEVLALYNTPPSEPPTLASLNEDMYLHWPFNTDVPPTDDIVDVTGNRYHGYFWQPVPGADPEGNENLAVSFEDSSDRLFARLRVNQGTYSRGFSFMAWVYPTQDNTTRRYIFTTDNGGHDWSMTHRSGAWHVFTGSGEQNTGFPVEYNRWQHVAGVWEPGVGVHFYKNGEHTLIEEISTDIGSHDFFLGGYNNGADHFVGRMDNVEIYDRLLSQTEIQAAFDAFTPPTGDLIARFDMNPTGPNFTNLSPFGPDGDTSEPELASNRFGEPGMAYRFDNGDAFDMQFRVNQRGDGPGATFSAWIYPTNINNGRRLLFYTDNGGWDWSMQMDGEWWGAFTGNGSYNSGHRVSRNEWQHISIVFKGTQTIVYKNGVPSVIGTIGFDGGTGRTTIGGFQGIMDDARVYRKALTAEEAMALYLHDERNPETAPELYESLYGYYPLDGDFQDYSGNDYHGNLRPPRPATDPTGVADGAHHFDGSNDYIHISRKINQSQYTSGLVFSAWVYPTSITETRYLFSSDNGGHDWAILRNGKQWSVFTGENHRNVGVGVDLHMWQHIAAVWDPVRNSVRFYKNGVEYEVPYLSFDTASDILRIGRHRDGGYFNGRIHDVRIFEANYSASEIRAIMDETTLPDPDGLFAYYPLDGDLFDYSVNHNPLNLGQPTPAPNRHGEPNQALSFDGRDDLVDLHYKLNNLSTGGGATIAMWVKADSYRAGTYYLVSGDQGGWDWSFTKFDERWGAFSGNGNYASGWDVKPGIWTHVAAVFNPSINKVTIYRDGKPSNINTIGFDGSSDFLRIGAYSNGGGGYFDGDMDEIFVYSRILSEAEIQALMNRDDDATLTTAQQDNLLGYYPFDGDYLDYGPAGNHGTLNANVPLFEQDPNDANNQYLRFDGINDRVLSDVYFNQSDMTRGFTFIGWIYPEDTSPLQSIFSSDNGGFDWTLRFSDGQYKVFTGESEQITSDIFLQPNQWQLVAAVWDPVKGETRVYANGQEAVYPLLSFDTSRWPVVLGYGTWGAYYKGLIDEVLLYHKPLTKEEVEAIFAKQQ